MSVKRREKCAILILLFLQLPASDIGFAIGLQEAPPSLLQRDTCRRSSFRTSRMVGPALLVPSRRAYCGSPLSVSSPTASRAMSDSPNSKDDTEDPQQVELLRKHYLAVARQDPEWLQTYVIDVLGTDEVGSEVLEVLQHARQSSPPTLQQPTGGEDDSGGASPIEVLVVQVQQPSATHKEQSAAVLEAIDDEENALTRSESPPTEGVDTLNMDPSNVDIVLVSLDNRKEDLISTNARRTDNSEGAIIGEGTENEKPTADREDRPPPSTTYVDPSSRMSEAAKAPETATSHAIPNAAIPNSTSTTPATDASSATTQAATPDNDRRVLYPDARRKSWSHVALDRLLKLGYTEAEIVSLQPEALDLIAQDGISRPRTGVPSRWRVNVAEGKRPAVQILEQRELQGFWETQQRPTQDSDPNGNKSVTSSPNLPRQQVSRQTPKDPAAASSVREAKRRNDRGEVDPDPRRPTSRRDRGADGRSRPIYSGRPTKAVLDDPPPSSSGIWPDMDSFRNMLRNEASLRLRILGDDWSEVVKEESDWRLDLYKKWLWALHNGVGDPIVESRSDRMRRLSRKYDDSTGRNRQSPVTNREARERRDQGQKKRKKA